ncbi:MAG: SpoIIE family protein phosphatase, partial [Candidatus Omnitrophica bacterium]|nr:SpoIIE family protein phosphatase [Candidatus Omnitrophota bacterium]
LLVDLTQKPTDQVLSSIENGIQNQVLYRDLTGKEDVFFAHDRVREAFYQRISEDERVPLHKHIAEVIEEQNKNDLDAVLYDLAYHFAQGKVEDKALQYCIPAANKAKNSYANALAINLYDSAKEILEKQRREKSEEYIAVLENLGELHRLTGEYDKSLTVLKSCEALVSAQDKMHKARVLSKIGDTLLERGESQNSALVFEQALGILSVRILSSKLGVVAGILKEFGRQMLHTWFPEVFTSKKYNASAQDLTTVRILNRLAHIYYLLDMNKAFYLILKTLNISEKMGPCPELAYNYTTAGPAWITFPWFSRAFRDSNKGLKMAQEIENKVSEGVAYSFLAYDYYYKLSEVKKSIECGNRAIAILLGVGEYWDLSVGWVFTAMSYLLTGQIQKALEESEKYVATMKRVGSYQTLAWGLLRRSESSIFLGNITSATFSDLDEGARLCKETKDNPNLLNTIGISGYAYFRHGDYGKAIEQADETVKLFPTHYNKGAWSLEILPMAVEIYLGVILSDDRLALSEKKEYFKKARYCCEQALSWSNKYDIFRGWSYQVNATYLWLTGKKKKAIKTWEKGIKFLREKTEDKYRLACILLEEAKFLLSDNPQDKKALGNLLEAKELFSSMGCKLDLKTCNDLLQKIMPSTEGLEGREALTQRRHLESLLSTTRAIGSVFDLDELLNKIMDYAITVTGAERGFLLLYDDKAGQLSLKLSHGFNALESFSFESSRVSLELIHEAEKQKDTLIASSDQAPTPKIQNELKSYNVKQALSAYLTSRDKPIGILYLDNQLSSGTFGKQELELMQSFAVQASVSLENAHLVSDLLDQARLRQELELGREIQMDLLPKVTPVIPGLKLSGLMLPAKEIGGDYYDFLVHKPQPAQGTDPSTAERLSVVIGDVSGKGVAAGLLMAMVKTCLYALNKQPITPKAILLSTNQMLYEHINAKKFMTMLYLTWDPSQKKLFYSSAGHEHILIYRKDGNVEAIISGGFMLGMVPEIDEYLEDRSLSLNPGDKVILYTDGVTEARNIDEDLFGLKRLTLLIQQHGHKPAQDLLSIIKEEVYAYIGTREQYDDITLVVMEAT